MNRLLALINIVCCSIWTGCSSVNIKTLDECPVVIQTETIAGHPLTVCDQKLLNDTLQIPLSLLAENLEIIHFDNREEALMGEHQVVLSDNYMLVWHSDVQPAKLFDRKGKFLTTIGAKGQGPGEYRTIYDVQIDEANNRIYMLPWSVGQLLVYDLQGNVLPSIPLCLNIPKGKLWINAKDSLIAVFALPFPNVPAVAWTQDLKGERKNYIEAGPLTAYDYNSEVYAGCNMDVIYDCMLKYSLPTRKDTLYHYDFHHNVLIPHFTMTFTTTNPIPNHDYFELPHHFLGTTAENIQISKNIFGTTNHKHFIIDKATGKGAYMHLVNDFLGNEELSLTSFDGNFPPYPNFRNGYYILNQDPGNLRDRLEKSMKTGKLSPEQKEKVTRLLNSVNENDNNLLFLAKLKQ